MSSRRREKAPDIRETSVFWAEFSPRLRSCADRYVHAPRFPMPDAAFVKPFPNIIHMTDVTMLGAFLDTHFERTLDDPKSLAHHFNYAMRFWSLYSDAIAMNPARLIHPPDTSVGIQLPNDTLVVLEIPSAYLSPPVSAPYGALLGSYVSRERFAHARVPREGLSAAAQDYVDDLTAWTDAVLTANIKSTRAMNFLAVVADCATPTAKFLTALPGLMDIAQRLVPGLVDAVLNHLKPLPGKHEFRREELSRRAPTWALDWAEHRGTLTAMMIAESNNPMFLGGVWVLHPSDIHP